MKHQDEPENVGGTSFPDESSGSESAYENSDDEQSYDEDVQVLPGPVSSRAISEGGRSRSVAKRNGKKDRMDSSSLNSIPSPKRVVFEDAVAWAASFQQPKVEDIKTPPRLSRRGRKRKAPPKPATETRLKRLKCYYNNDYRELLNSEIQDAASRVADSGGLEESQVGSSIWTAAEKAMLFVALGKLGRGDVRGIAERIGSKAQHEVQVYVNLLQDCMQNRSSEIGKSWAVCGTSVFVMVKKQNLDGLLAPTDIPAAVEVSDECAAILERAGDALATHQEFVEEKLEKGKWGDSWLINADIALQMGKRRKQVSGEEQIEEVLPAANLLNLSKWIELSDQIFMNAGSPREEDNWQAIAEPGETPAVRATAFEDFHSLAFNITKRLVSAVLFCCMSRMKAKKSKKVKHAHVNPDDVKTAVNILGLKADSHHFWRGVAKRNSLQVVDDDHDEPVLMTYNGVETALRKRHPRSRSRSARRKAKRKRSRIRRKRKQAEKPSRHPDQTEDVESSMPDINETDPDSDANSESQCASPLNSDEEFMSSPAPSSPSSDDEPLFSTPDFPQSEEADAAFDAYTEVHDMHTSQTSEIHLWDLLEQDSPFEFTLLPVLGRAPKFGRDEPAERENWREHVGSVNEWEVMKRPVPKKVFARNRRRAEGREGDMDVDVDFALDDKADDDEDEDEDESAGHRVDDEDGQQGDIAISEEQEEQDVDMEVLDDDEHLQV